MPRIFGASMKFAGNYEGNTYLCFATDIWEQSNKEFVEEKAQVCI